MDKTSASVDISKFPRLQQETNYYCVPASLLAILKYHNNNLAYAQSDLFHLMNDNPSFGAVKNLSIDGFDFDIKYPSGFTNEAFINWINNIKAEIEYKRPVAIAFRESNNQAHIRVALAYDENCFTLFDPATTNFEKYYFYQAEADFIEDNRCFDILITKYVTKS
ncbi:MAG TPA: C39 family peptidase [Panacibacter sp.]|nr:C39 family peptidase [Panacibacter sp.]